MDDTIHLDLSHGLCVGVRIPSTGVPEEWAKRLQAEELAFAASVGEARRITWIAGRVALHQALQRLGVACGAILANARGGPDLPAGVAGSVSHKSGIAVALVSRGSGAQLGVDIEAFEPPRPGVERKVLTEEELLEWRSLPEERRWADTIVRFSIKEAIYKAIDPFLERLVGYWEVGASPAADGSVRVTASLERPLAIEARWQRVEGYVLSTARAGVAGDLVP